MEFWRAILGLIRRPLVGPPVFVLSLGLAAVAYLQVPAHYASSTTMVLTTPTTGGTLNQDPNNPTGLSNPLLHFGDGLRTTASIVIQVLNTPQAQETLGVQAGTTLVVNDGRTDPNLLGTNGPFIHIESESKSAADAQLAVSKARQFAQEELARRQQAVGAPPSTFIVAVDVVPPSAPEAQTGAKTQAAVVTMVLSFLLGICGIYLAFSVLPAVRQRARVPSHAVSPTVPPAVPPPVSPILPPAVPARAQSLDGLDGPTLAMESPTVALESPTVQLPARPGPAAPMPAPTTTQTNGAAVRARASNSTDVTAAAPRRVRRWRPPGSRTEPDVGTSPDTGG